MYVPGVDRRLLAGLNSVTALGEAADRRHRGVAAVRSRWRQTVGRAVRAGRRDAEPRPDTVVGLDPSRRSSSGCRPSRARWYDAARQAGDVDPLEREDPRVVVRPAHREAVRSVIDARSAAPLLHGRPATWRAYGTDRFQGSESRKQNPVLPPARASSIGSDSPSTSRTSSRRARANGRGRPRRTSRSAARIDEPARSRPSGTCAA